MNVRFRLSYIHCLQEKLKYNKADLLTLMFKEINGTCTHFYENFFNNLKKHKWTLGFNL
jgi:hypothetical protein